MSKKPTLYLHIGHPKTGSTTIQRFLHENQELTAAAGLLQGNYHMKFEERGKFWQPPLSVFNKIRDNGHDPKALRSLIEAGCVEAEKAGAKGLVVSAENLCGGNRAKAFTDLVDLVDIKIAYYVRRRDDFLVSAWKQWHSKRGESLEDFIARWLRKPVGFYQDAIEEWKDIPGVSEIYVKPLHRSGLYQGGLCKDFAHWLGLDTNAIKEVAATNVSYHHDFSLLMSYAPELFPNIHDNTITNFLEHSAKDIMGRKNGEILGYKLREEIWKVSKQDYEFVHANYFPELDFETLFGISNFDPEMPPYKADNDRLMGRTFALAVSIMQQQEGVISELTDKVEGLVKQNENLVNRIEAIEEAGNKDGGGE